VARRRPPDPELERRLLEHGRLLGREDLPDVSGRVRERLAASPARRTWTRPLAIAVAVVLAGVAAIAVVPAARTGVLDAFGLRSVHVVAVDELPPLRPRGRLDAGARLPLAAASRAAPFRIRLPGGREPSLVLLGGRSARDAVPGGVVSLVYGRPGAPRLFVQEFLGRSPGPELVKGLPRRLRAERVSVDGAPGLWLGGAHAMSFVDAHGVTRGASARLTGRTLVWQSGDVVIRIEGGFDRDEAIRLARTFS